MTWTILVLSGLLEIIWSTAMKLSDGFTRVGPSVIMFVAAAIGFWLLGWAMHRLPLGTAYAVWVGIGAVGAFVVGLVWFDEPATPLRLTSAGMIIMGIIGLRLAEGGEA